MPYGLPVEETPELTKWLEHCVEAIKGTNKRTSNPYTKGEKIAICKMQLKKMGWKVPKESESQLGLREKLREIENKIYDAIREKASPIEVSPSYGPWLDEIFDDYLIVAKDDKVYSAPYTINGDDVVGEPVQDQSRWKLEKHNAKDQRHHPHQPLLLRVASLWCETLLQPHRCGH